MRTDQKSVLCFEFKDFAWRPTATVCWSTFFRSFIRWSASRGWRVGEWQRCWLKDFSNCQEHLFRELCVCAARILPGDWTILRCSYVSLLRSIVVFLPFTSSAIFIVHTIEHVNFRCCWFDKPNSMYYPFRLILSCQMTNRKKKNSFANLSISFVVASWFLLFPRQI